MEDPCGFAPRTHAPEPVAGESILLRAPTAVWCAHQDDEARSPHEQVSPDSTKLFIARLEMSGVMIIRMMFIILLQPLLSFNLMRSLLYELCSDAHPNGRAA